MIELSSEARRSYEVMIENLELTSQAEQEDLEAHPSAEPQPQPPPSAEPQPPPCKEELEEPEYSKWKAPRQTSYCTLVFPQCPQGYFHSLFFVCLRHKHVCLTMCG